VSRSEVSGTIEGEPVITQLHVTDAFRIVGGPANCELNPQRNASSIPPLNTASQATNMPKSHLARLGPIARPFFSFAARGRLLGKAEWANALSVPIWQRPLQRLCPRHEKPGGSGEAHRAIRQYRSVMKLCPSLSKLVDAAVQYCTARSCTDVTTRAVPHSNAIAVNGAAGEVAQIRRTARRRPA
jgi:hypothetical protein